MSEKNRRVESLVQKLKALKPLPAGLGTDARIKCLAMQIVDSERRIEFVYTIIRSRSLSPVVLDPYSSSFDPLKGAILESRRGDISNAWWLTFLFVHFGRHEIDKYKAAAAIYGGLGSKIWDWNSISNDFSSFITWYRDSEKQLLSESGLRRFGSHRQYMSYKSNYTLKAIESFKDWMTFGAEAKRAEILRVSGQKPEDVFDVFFSSVRGIEHFGRLASFDFVTMLAKLGLIPAEPGHPYFAGATGPRRGANLLWKNSTDDVVSVKEATKLALELSDALGIGHQVIEDSLCNWQKSPEDYIYFRG